MNGDNMELKVLKFEKGAKATMCIVPRNQIKEAILNGKNI